MIRFSRYAIVMVASLLVVGCKSGPRTTLKSVPFDLQLGWTKHENSAKGFTVGIPSGWASRQMLLEEAKKAPPLPGAGTDPQAAQMDRLMAAMSQADVAAIEAHIKKDESQGVYLYCVNQGVRQIVGEAQTHFSLEVQNVGGNAQMDDVVEMLKKDTNGKEPPHPVDLPIGKAMKVQSRTTLVDGGEVTRVEYGLVNGSSQYILRFVTEEANNELDKTADDVAQTLRIK
ncbi:MAG: hypothetical protein ACHQ50_08395 [Fimbriimonadales bacterium]